MIPSNHSSLSSPPQSTTLSDIFPFDDLLSDFIDKEYQVNSSFDNLGTTLPTNNHLETVFINNNSGNSLSDINNFPLDDKLMIIAEPKEFYRERYSCETDPKKNRAQRYIRTEDGSKYEHPTIEVCIIYLNCFIFH